MLDGEQDILSWEFGALYYKIIEEERAKRVQDQKQLGFAFGQSSRPSDAAVLLFALNTPWTRDGRQLDEGFWRLGKSV